MDLASSFLANEQPRMALRHLKAVQDLGEDKPDYHFLYGLIAAKLDRREEACAHLQRATDMDPEFAQAWNNLGKLRASLGHKAQAEQAFRRALEIPTYLNPEFPAYNLARLYEEEGKSAQAVKMARQSFKANPAFVPASMLLSRLLTEDGRLEDAEEVLNRALRAQPKNTRLMLALAETLLRQGEHKQAREWFERIVQSADPKSDTAQVARDYLELLPGRL